MRLQIVLIVLFIACSHTVSGQDFVAACAKAASQGKYDGLGQCIVKGVPPKVMAGLVKCMIGDDMIAFIKTVCNDRAAFDTWAACQVVKIKETNPSADDMKQMATIDACIAAM